MVTDKKTSVFKKSTKAKKISLIILTFLAATICIMFLFACGDPAKEKITGNPTSEKDSFYTEGYRKGTVSLTELLDDLFNGYFNTIKPVSDAKPVSTKDTSLEGEADFVANGRNFNMLLRLNYSTEKSENVVAIEIRNTEKTETYIGIYHQNDDDSPIMYVKVGNTKMKIPHEPFADGRLNLLAPLASSAELSAIPFTDIIKLKDKSTLKYEYKVDSKTNTYTRHFYIPIDIVSTLKALVNVSVYDTNTADWDFLFKNLLGAEKDKIKSGSIPPITVDLDFTTVDGASTFGKGRLSEMKFSVDVAASSQYHETVFAGASYSAKVSVVTFKTQNSLIADILPQEVKSYTQYDLQPYKVTLDFYYATEPNVKYNLIAEIDYRHNNINTSVAAIYIEHPTTKERRLALFYDDGQLWFNYLNVDTQKIISVHCDMDLTNLINNVKELQTGGEESLINRSLIYALGSLSIINDNSAKYTYNYTNLNNLLSLTTQAVVDIINTSTATGDKNFTILLAENGDGLQFSTLLQTSVSVSIDINKTFIQKIDEVVFPDDLSAL
jgi:hypothetical protein